MTDIVRVSACQTPDFRENTEEALAYLERRAHEAEQAGVHLLLFPEGYLQGYLTEPEAVRKNALNLSSQEFKKILSRLRKIQPTLVVGLIEESEGMYYNSAAVIDQGILSGSYRKTHLLPGESVFTPVDSYPTFELQGVRFGINICYDMQFAEAAAEVKQASADIILCPANNMMRYENAEKWKFLHHEMRIERAKETGLWVISADVTGERDGRIGYGPTSVINPEGVVVEQVALMTEGVVRVDINRA